MGMLKTKLYLLLNRGNRYACPLCGYSSRKLELSGLDLPVLTERQVVGAGRRPTKCLKCGSTDRERLVWAYLNYKLRLFDDKNNRILHIAPERRLSEKLFDSGFAEYLCGDLHTGGYEYPDRVTRMDILRTPFDDGHFDLIICNHVLEHIIPDEQAMKELVRILKKGGKAVLQVPISMNSETTFEDESITEPKQREAAFGQFDHVRIYGQNYARRLEKSGFIVTRMNISQEYMDLGLNPKEDIFIGTK